MLPVVVEHSWIPYCAWSMKSSRKSTKSNKFMEYEKSEMKLTQLSSVDKNKVYEESPRRLLTFG